MKHTVLSLLLATVFAFTSCTDTAFLPEPPAPDDGSRAIVPGNQSETNPTLLTDWKTSPPSTSTKSAAADNQLP